MSRTLTAAPAPRRDRQGRIVPTVCGLATASPETYYDQGQMLELLGLADDPFAREVFARCGVRRRALEISPELLASTLQQRTQRTEDQLMRLSTRAVDALAVDPAEIGVVVTASYYSLGGPTLAHRLVDHYALAADTDKYHVVGVGCASSVPLLRLAAGALRDRSGPAKALVVAAESVSGFITPFAEGDEKVKIIGSALFGDGAAAALLSLDAGSDDGPAIVATAVHQLSGTLDHVRLAVEGHDAHMQIARELPAIAESGVPELVDGLLARHGIDRGSIDHWPLHPGGRGILDGLQKGLGLSDEAVAPSAAVLAAHGNVGTPSAFYVLRRTILDRDPRAGERGVAITIGPGVTVGLMLLQW